MLPRLLLASALSLAVAASTAGECPCSDPNLCKPISGAPVKPIEIFGFTVSATSRDWSRITTIAWPTDPMLVCEAHAHGVRVVMNASPPITANMTARAAFVERTVRDVQAGWLDGVVFDFESPLPQNSPNATWYSEIIAETRAALHEVNPSYQVSTCVAWSPDDIDGRGYDMPALAAASDILYVMDYDTRSQIVDVCLASANSPLGRTKLALQRYLDIGIPPSKLVLGVPWYGYKYPCLPGTSPVAEFCPIQLKPFRGIQCSDAAGTEVGFETMLKMSKSSAASTPIRWDNSTSSPFFNTWDEGSGAVTQWWFDNPKSLSLKYEWAAKLGLRGVGPFTFSDASLSGPFAAEGTAMFEALDAFIKPREAFLQSVAAAGKNK